ncbi:hypothetical protein PHLGIDRAFT_71502 [Phlebiopsis gigantea 11061_1 CR5-6]|uniref:BTB domain-containing protein n=1 Tax=Phlebiopsis gigantea (strain 11061_1 CR5-6) TaxID=745531 RepID=A0A0C3SAM9_PHLG1|nr:hypothetical protein PHLGIDRAFT_71502 [Phlebiopsis gigantea 11061_1 CR5-6]
MEYTVTPHHKFHFNHGDVAIHSAPDSEGKATAYRVNKAVLALNSTVFADMFTLPDADGLHEMDDGVPVVVVTDSEEELSALMQALYEPHTLFSCRFDPETPIRLTPVMKLANKYEMDTIRERAVEAVCRDWPETFEQWARINAEIHSLIDRTPEAAAAVRFARDFNIPSILPAAYYALAHSDRNWHWDSRNVFGNQWRYVRYTRWELLDAIDYKVVLCLRSMLVGKLSNVVSQYTGETNSIPVGPLTVCPSTHSESHATCATGLAEILQRWKENELDLGSMLAEAEGPNPLGLLDQLHRMHTTAEMCGGCKTRLGRHITMYQIALWEQVVLMTETFQEEVQ